MRTKRREFVYDAIDGEREHQNLLGSERTDGHTHTVGDYVTMMNYYMQKLNEEWTMNAGDRRALDVLRKMAAIAVAAMEENEIVKRGEF